MEAFELALYWKNNKAYILTDFMEWSDKKLIDLAKLLERYDEDCVCFIESWSPDVYKEEHPRINDYDDRESKPDKEKTVTVHAIEVTKDYEFGLHLVFNNGRYNSRQDIVIFKNAIIPSRVKLVQKDYKLTTYEREELENIMDLIGLPNDKESVNKEIEECVGLFEVIQI